MLKQVSKAPLTHGFILRANLVPDIHRHNRRLAILIDDHRQAVRQGESFIGNGDFWQGLSGCRGGCGGGGSGFGGVAIRRRGAKYGHCKHTGNSCRKDGGEQSWFARETKCTTLFCGHRDSCFSGLEGL